MKTLCLHPEKKEKNIGRRCWGITAHGESGLDSFLVFLALLSASAAVRNAVSLRRCESPADFLLAGGSSL